MEPPPRLYNYKGLFTSYRSVDLSLKILMILIVLVALVLLTSWHISRKFYRRAASFRSNIHNVKALLRDYSLAVVIGLGVKSKLDLLSTKIGKSMVLVINNWRLIRLYEVSESLDCFYSAAPSSLRRKWYGLLMADSTLTNRANLRSIILHAFSSLPVTAYLSLGYISSCTLHTLENLNIDGVLDAHELDLWLRPVVADFLFFSYHEFGKKAASSFRFSTEMAHFINRFACHVVKLECYHFDGNLTGINQLLVDGDVKTKMTVIDFLSELENLIHPLVRRSATKTSICDGSTLESPYFTDTSLSFLCQLIRSCRELELQGEYLGFLKVDHLAHSLSELGMILHMFLTKHIRLLLVVLAQRPLWRSRLQSEADFAHDKLVPLEDSSVKFDPQHSLEVLFRQANYLVWTKSLVCESMRFYASAWPFGCLRQAVRDGELNGFEYAEGELVLFNEPFYFSDPDLWEDGAALPSDTKYGLIPFNPTRFMEYELGTTNVYHLKWPVHWMQFMLKAYTVCVPNETFYRMLTSILLHLFWSGWKIRNTNSEDLSLSDDPVWISSDLPDIHLQSPNQQ